MKTKMLAGQVVRIRVNPRDCMGAVDVIRVLGLQDRRFSFDQVVRIALSSLLESARDHKIIPERQGFEFLEMMRPYQDESKAHRGEKLALTKIIDERVAEPIKPVASNPEMRKKELRFRELSFKMEVDELNITDSDRDELRDLTNALFPDPDLVNTK